MAARRASAPPPARRPVAAYPFATRSRKRPIRTASGSPRWAAACRRNPHPPTTPHRGATAPSLARARQTHPDRRFRRARTAVSSKQLAMCLCGGTPPLLVIPGHFSTIACVRSVQRPVQPVGVLRHARCGKYHKQRRPAVACDFGARFDRLLVIFAERRWRRGRWREALTLAVVWSQLCEQLLRITLNRPLPYMYPLNQRVATPAYCENSDHSFLDELLGACWVKHLRHRHAFPLPRAEPSLS